MRGRETQLINSCRVNQGTPRSFIESTIQIVIFPSNAQDSITVHPDCVSVYNELKLGKGAVRYVIYKLSDDYKEIVVEEQSGKDDYEAFREKLVNAKSMRGGKESRGPRYAVYDFEFELQGGEGKR